MRNIFDQYAQPENRVTHAFMTALNEDRRLLGLFLREMVKTRAPVNPSKLSVLEQQYPGEHEPSEEELERRGIPDGWIFDDEWGWCVFIESKVLAKLYADQIRRHKATAERRGFQRVIAVAIAPRIPLSLPSDVVTIEWRDLYTWLRRHAADSSWAARTVSYLEIAEAKLVETEQFREGTLTRFAGFPFSSGHPYTYLEGKRTLILALGELRGRRELRRKLGMDPDRPGRPAITGRQSDRVWDFLSIAPTGNTRNFTNYPHLTLGVGSDQVEAVVTVPHAVNGHMRQNLKRLGETGFADLTAAIVLNLKPLLKSEQGATPSFKGIQRRYPSQRAVPIIDAVVEFDLRTAAPGGPPKSQPVWLAAAYGAFVEKARANYQIQIGVVFRYDRCPDIGQPHALDLIEAAWLACDDSGGSRPPFRDDAARHSGMMPPTIPF